MENRYIPPSFDVLCERVDYVSDKYGDGSRKPLTNLLKAVRELSPLCADDETSDIEKDSDDEVQTFPDENEARKILLGAWVLCLEEILLNYPRLTPEEFTIFGWKIKGSCLFTLLNTHLNITVQNPLDDKSRLICLEKLYNALFGNDREILSNYEVTFLDDYGINLTALKKQLKTAMKNVLHRIDNNISRLLTAVPVETVIQGNLDIIHLTYQEEKSDGDTHKYIAVNQEREFACQFLMAVSHILPDVIPQEAKTSTELSRSERIRIGAVLYIMQTINDEYYVRSPLNSKLYKICCEKILNLSHHDNLNHKTRNDCLETFKTALSDNQFLQSIERYGREHYSNYNLLMHVDGRIHTIEDKLDIMLKTPPASNWPMTNLLSYMGGLLCMAPGYGLGVVVGDVASETESIVKPKVLAGRSINRLGTVLLGAAGGTLGFLAADFVIRSSLERLFAKVLEQAGYIIGRTTGGTVGFAIDLSYKGLKRTCSYVLGLMDQVSDPTILKNLDREFLVCLLNLPDDVLSIEDQEHLEKITGINPELSVAETEMNDGESEIYYYNSDTAPMVKRY